MHKRRIRKRFRDVTLKDTKPYVPDVYYGKVLKVYDGDTITIGTLINARPCRLSVRLYGIDCPEMKTKCDIEKQAAIYIRDKLREKILDRFVSLRVHGYDKYGRLLANTYVDGLCIEDWLLSKKYAVPYDGKTKPDTDWSNVCP